MCNTYCLAKRMLGVRPTEHARTTRAYESLGVKRHQVLLNRCILARARRLLAMEDTCLPKTVLPSGMAKGRRPQGRPHLEWTNTVKASLAQANLRPGWRTQRTAEVLLYEVSSNGQNCRCTRHFRCQHCCSPAVTSAILVCFRVWDHLSLADCATCLCVCMCACMCVCVEC